MGWVYGVRVSDGFSRYFLFEERGVGDDGDDEYGGVMGGIIGWDWRALVSFSCHFLSELG